MNLRRLSTACLTAMLAVSPLAAQQNLFVARAMLGDSAIAINAEELKLEVVMLRRSAARAGLATTTVDALDAIVRQILERKLLAAEARRRELDRQTGVENLLNRSADSVLAETIAARESAALDTSPAAVTAFYDAHREAFRSPPRRQVRHIVVASEDAARAARAEIAAGATFEAVARARNIDGTAATGGELGWVTRGTMVQGFDAELFRIDRGTVSAPVKTAMGWHLILVEDVDPGYLPPVQLANDQVVDAMKRDAIARLTRRLIDESHPTIDRAALGELLQ